MAKSLRSRLFRRLRLVALEERAVPAGNLSLISQVDPNNPATGGGGHSSLDTPRQHLSDDGRYIVYTSEASNLFAGLIDTNNTQDVFIYDRVTNTNTLASRNLAAPNHSGNGSSFSPVISGDGRYVAFASTATDLVGGFIDGNNGEREDTYLFDRITATMTLVSHQFGGGNVGGNGASGAVDLGRFATIAISNNGQFITFISRAGDLTAVGAGQLPDVNLYLYDRSAGTNEIVSSQAGSAPAIAGVKMSWLPTISSDGRYVTYQSSTNNLTSAGTPSGSTNIFLYDRIANANRLVSHNATTSAAGNNDSVWPDMSADGQFVVYTSLATNLVAGFSGNEGRTNVFAYSVATDATELVSAKAGTTTTGGTYPSGADMYMTSNISVSADGRYIAFLTQSGDVLDAMDKYSARQIAIRDRITATITLVGNGESPTISADGRYVAYYGVPIPTGGYNDGV